MKCGICGKNESSMCSSCHLKDVVDLHKRIDALEKRTEALEGYITALHDLFVKEAVEV